MVKISQKPKIAGLDLTKSKTTIAAWSFKLRQILNGDVRTQQNPSTWTDYVQGPRKYFFFFFENSKNTTLSEQIQNYFVSFCIFFFPVSSLWIFVSSSIASLHRLSWTSLPLIAVTIYIDTPPFTFSIIITFLFSDP